MPFNVGFQCFSNLLIEAFSATHVPVRINRTATIEIENKPIVTHQRRLYYFSMHMEECPDLSLISGIGQ